MIVRHCLHVVKSVFHHQRVFCLAKPIFLTVDTVTDTVNVYNVVRYVTSTHVRKVFPSTHSSISIPTQVYCPKKKNNIANSHLPLTNLLPSSETKSSTLSLTSNLCFSECTFSLPEISCPRIFHHVSSSLKFSLFLWYWNFKFLSSFYSFCHLYNVFITLLSTVLKSVNFTVSLFDHIFKYRITVTFLFLTFEHERIFENYLSVNRSFMKISYLSNPFNNDFKNFNVFLTNFSSFSDFRPFRRFLSVMPCVMWRPLIWHSMC